MQMSINAGCEDIRISTPGILSIERVGALLPLAIEVIIIEPILSSSMVECHLTRRNLNDNISIVSQSVVCILREHLHEIVSEIRIAHTW